jgi:DNA-binding NtrC family response regulator
MPEAPEPNPPVLIVDDDAGQRSLLDAFLRSQGFRTRLAASGEEALQALDAEDFSMMVSDVRMPGISGLETLRRARKQRKDLPVLMVTAYSDIRDAVGAMRDGAVDYLSKPIDLDALLASVRRATGVPEKAASADIPKLPPHIVAASPLMQAAFRDAALVAGSDTRVLITGESGSGKEVVADLIHEWSRRAKGPLIKVNCAAIPENLLESELFGHEKGAFSGATSARAGRFEAAAGGDIFLDEIGEMSPLLQAKLLRVTQDGTFQRVGSNREWRTDARLLAATNRNLDAEVAAGRFREDLFYRLNVFELNVPSLRERPEDILPLANAFLVQFATVSTRLSASAADALLRHAWPGNVRELRNAMERAALLSQGEMIMPEHLPARVQASASKSAPAAGNETGQDLQAIEREAILEALKKCGNNRSETARLLGISRRALLYKLQRYQKEGFDIGRD